MKKLYSLAVLAIFAASGSIAQNTSPSTESVQVIHRAGSDVISSLRQSYESGSYDAFLANLTSDYLKLMQGGKLAEFIKMREIPAADDKLKELAAKWESLHHKLIEERNDALLAACKGHEQEINSGRIQSIIRQIPDEQREALQYLSSLRFKTPENAANVDEKKLIEIDIAAEFKAVHLDSQFAQKPFEDRLEKQMVINMDSLKQMQDAAQSFKDPEIVKKVMDGAQAFDAWQARHWDLNLLHQVIRKPSNDFEKKIAAILTEYKAKKDDLYQKEFLSQIK
jgi:hypothetical protein